MWRRSSYVGKVGEQDRVNMRYFPPLSSRLFVFYYVSRLCAFITIFFFVL